MKRYEKVAGRLYKKVVTCREPNIKDLLSEENNMNAARQEAAKVAVAIRDRREAKNSKLVERRAKALKNYNKMHDGR